MLLDLQKKPKLRTMSLCEKRKKPKKKKSSLYLRVISVLILVADI